MTNKEKIIALFNQNVRGKRPDMSQSNQSHDGRGGHWLELMMGIQHNSSNTPDLFGYEMKNDTSSKTTFGDWSASYYIFQKTSGYGIDRSEFLCYFGKPNLKKDGRHSWSGEPCPRIHSLNRFGQQLVIDGENNIHAMYHFSKDNRPNKSALVPPHLQAEDLVLARWDASLLKNRVEAKFNNMGWFKCEINTAGVYSSIVFGDPISFEKWIGFVREGDVYFDSGMYEGNARNYSQWRAPITRFGRNWL